MTMTGNQKERTRKLIQQGGLVELANMGNLPPDLLLELLLHCRQYLDGLNDQQKAILQQSGDALLQQRATAKKELRSLQIPKPINPFSQ